MNRRLALFSTFVLGGLIPRGLLAQSTKRRDRAGWAGSTRVAQRPADEKADPVPEVAEPEGDDAPANFPSQPGQEWKTFKIAKYTNLAGNQTKPQNAIVEWIFRRTGWSPWHEDRVAVLSASRSEIRVYNTAKIIEQVGQVVERFTDAQADILKVRVRYITATDPRWRYPVNSRMTTVGMGPQGQQIWVVKVEDAAMILAQLGLNQGSKRLADQTVPMVNGQTLTVKTTENRNYIAGLQRASAAGLGFQPTTQPLEEGVVLRFSPLLTYDGTELEADIDLKTNVVRALHHTNVLAPREVGPVEMTIDVPEATESRLKQTIRDWPLDHTLVISAGIQPGILQSKTGFLNLRIPGTVPTTTELLVFIDVRIDRTTSRLTRERKSSASTGNIEEDGSRQTGMAATPKIILVDDSASP